MGHQVVTWCAGWVLADVLGLRFAHTPVAEPWESHLYEVLDLGPLRDRRSTNSLEVGSDRIQVFKLSTQAS